MTKKLLFVCTGNTCRSPMAKELARKVFQEAGVNGWQIDSAGLSAAAGMPASVYAVEVMAGLGLDLSGHSAKLLSPPLAEAADLILVMTQGHKEALLRILPKLAGKVYTVREFAGETGDVPDPFGAEAAVYLHTAVQLRRLMERLAEKMRE